MGEEPSRSASRPSCSRAQELAELRRASAERYRQLADAMPQIVWTADATGAPTYYNRRWFEYTGMTEDERRRPRLGARHASGRPAAGDRAARARRSRAAASSRSSTASVAADGTYRWHLGRAVPIRDEDGSIDFWIGTATDIDDRKRTEEAQRFLLDAGAELSRSLDWRAGLKAVARLAVPRIADWCAVHVAEEDGTISSLAIEHADPGEGRSSPASCRSGTRRAATTRAARPR